MAIVIEGLIIPSLLLAIVYLLLFLYGCRKLLKLHQQTPGLNTKKLFVMNCLLASILRFLSFSSMCIFNYLEVTVSLESRGGGIVIQQLMSSHLQISQSTSSSSSSSPNSNDYSYGITHITDNNKIPISAAELYALEDFFYKASIVQFDLPDFCFVSAYVLLLVVWAEAILQSRRHWLSSASFRRIWILGYVIFNIFLYSIQVSLYSLLFFSEINQQILGCLIYITLTIISLGVPLIWVCCYLYLSIMFSGFPFQSYEARERLRYLGSLGTFWTVTRLVWGTAALTSVLNGWFVKRVLTQQVYIFTLMMVFLVCEVIPILASLRNSALSNLVVGPTTSTQHHDSHCHSSSSSSSSSSQYENDDEGAEEDEEDDYSSSRTSSDFQEYYQCRDGVGSSSSNIYRNNSVTRLNDTHTNSRSYFPFSIFQQLPQSPSHHQQQSQQQSQSQQQQLSLASSDEKNLRGSVYSISDSDKFYPHLKTTKSKQSLTTAIGGTATGTGAAGRSSHKSLISGAESTHSEYGSRSLHNHNDNNGNNDDGVNKKFSWLGLWLDL